MVSDTSLRDFHGLFHYYKKVHRHRQKLFLQRNLRDFLDSHNYAIRAMREDSENTDTRLRPANGLNGTWSDRKTRSKTASSINRAWKLPASEKALKALLAAQEDVFELNVGEIRPLYEGSSQDRKRRNRAKNTSLPNELPAWELPCKLELQIYKNDKSSSADRIWDIDSGAKSTCLRKELHEATIRGYSSNPTKHAIRLQVDMDEPMKFSTGPLIARRKSDQKNGKLDQSCSWMIDISISFDDDEWLQLVLGEIRSEKRPQFQTTKDLMEVQGTPTNSDRLLVRWKGTFTSLGPQSHLVELRHCKNTQVSRLAYGLEVNMRLSPPLSSSALEHHNNVQRKLSNQKLPDSMPRDVSREKTREAVKIIYILKSRETEHEMKYDDYICPLCNDKNLHRFDLLHLHLYHNHTLCRFKVDKEEEIGGRGSIITVRIGVCIAKTDVPVRRKDPFTNWNPLAVPIAPKQCRKGKDAEITWITPDSPFDVEQYQQGDESWFDQGSETSAKRLLRRSIPTNNTSTTAPVATMTASPLRLTRPPK